MSHRLSGQLETSNGKFTVMNRAFVQATGRYHAYKDLAATLSHTQRVTRLYRVRACAL